MFWKPIQKTSHVEFVLWIFVYQVQGVGVSNLFRLRPLVGLILPINSTLDHHIKLYNPHPFPIQVSVSILLVTSTGIQNPRLYT